MSGSESNEGRIVHVYEGFHEVKHALNTAPSRDELLDGLLEALADAANATDRDPFGREGPEGWYKLELFGRVTRNSPGWFDGFAIRVSTPPS